jgi:hypothetical protein
MNDLNKNMKDNLDFGVALYRLKQGAKVVRAGWDGKDQYVTLLRAGNAMHQGFDMQDCLALKNTQNNMQPGWTPSQGDLLAEDWLIVSYL